MTVPDEVDIIVCGGGSSGCVPAGRKCLLFSTMIWRDLLVYGMAFHIRFHWHKLRVHPLAQHSIFKIRTKITRQDNLYCCLGWEGANDAYEACCVLVEGAPRPYFLVGVLELERLSKTEVFALDRNEVLPLERFEKLTVSANRSGQSRPRSSGPPH